MLPCRIQRVLCWSIACSVSVALTSCSGPARLDDQKTKSSATSGDGEASTAGFRTLGADNPLFLPTPLEPGKPGAVLLHGGEGEHQLSDEIFNWFIERAGGKKANIVLIPSGELVRRYRVKNGKEQFTETEEEFEARCADYFSEWTKLVSKGRIAKFQFLYTENQLDQDDPEFVAALDDATGVWFPASFQGKLGWRFTHKYKFGPASYEGDSKEPESLFQLALRKVVARGHVVGGQGAGMAALSEIMMMGNTEDDLPAVAYTTPGLALFSGAIVEQNFKNRPGRLERFTNLLKDTERLNEEANWPAVGRRMIGLAVDADTAIAVEGNTIQALGDGHGHIFFKENGDRTIHWRLLAPDDGKVEIVAASNRPRSKTTDVQPSNLQDASTRNPFGIPEPVAGAPPGSIVLHGGGPNGDLIAIYPGLASVSQPKLVHCPSATRSFHPAKGESADDLQTRLEDFFDSWVDLRDEGRLGKLTFLSTADPADARRETFVSPLKSADAVWFSGGDQSILTELYGDAKNTTPFQQELIEVVRRGGVVGGTSAGTAVMARIMTVSGEPQERGWTKPQISYGFGLLNNVIIEQHFNGRFRRGRIERFTRLLLDQQGELEGFLGSDGHSITKSIGMAVEERTALLLQENRLRVFGQQNAHIFLKSADNKTISWHDLHPGDAAFIVPGPNGPKLELDDWGLR